MKPLLGTALIKVANALLGIVVAIVLARALGAADYGVYSTAFVLASVISVFAQFGLSNLVLRETAVAAAGENYSGMKSIWIWASRVALSFAFAAIAVGAIAGFVLRGNYSSAQLATYFLALAVVPFLALGTLRAAALRGLGHAVLSQFPQLVLRPFLLLVLALLLGRMVPASPQYAMVMQLSATVGAFLAGSWLLWKFAPKELLKATAGTFPRRQWWTASGIMALSAGMNQINNYADILLLGLFRSSEEVGQYRAAFQVSALVAFGVQVVAMVYAAKFAQFRHNTDPAQFQKIVSRAARLAFGFAFPAALVLVLWGGFFLELLFGAEFRDGYAPLAILAAGQAMAAFFGSIGILLNMSGMEKHVAKGMGFVALSNLVLNIVLIPPFGMTGAALATVLSISVWKVHLWHSARKELHVDSRALVFGGRRDG